MACYRQPGIWQDGIDAMQDGKQVSQPSDIAREALKRLAARQLPPTPVNFQACYNEIAGVPNAAAFPEPPLRELLEALPVRNAAQAAQVEAFGRGIRQRSWKAVSQALLAFVEAGREGSTGSPAIPLPPGALFPALLRMVDALRPLLGQGDPRSALAAGDLRDALLAVPADGAVIEEALGRFATMATYVGEEQVEIHDMLLVLLRLLVDNVGELVADDRWLAGQIEGVRTAIAPPLTLRRLDEVGRRLREVLDKQGRAKERTIEAQAEVRELLSTFVERLGGINATSADFVGRVEADVRRVEQATRIEEVAPLIGDIVASARSMAAETAKSRELLTALEERVKATEAELAKLHLELDNASEMARHDPLTDALNRKGLDEALAREIAGVRRKGGVLSLAMLDIDNFKQLNDRLGHEAGDAALVHLTAVARRCMRPSDTLARFGGEEFVILMPETTLPQGVEVMTRLQRELTRAFFLAGPERVLITFSAGVAELAVDEDGAEALRRADQAMYLAKRAGKNRVFGA